MDSATIFRSVEKEAGVESDEIKPVSEMTEDDGDRSEATLVTSTSLEEVDKVGVEDSRSSACGDPSPGERVNVRVLSSDSMLDKIVDGVGVPSSGERVNDSVSSSDSLLICDVDDSDEDVLDKIVVGVVDSSSGERVNVSVSSSGEELTSSDVLEAEDDEGERVVGDTSLGDSGDITCDSV